MAADPSGTGEYSVATSHRARTSARLLGPGGEVVADGQGVWVLGAQHPLEDGQQRGVLVAGPSKMRRAKRIPDIIRGIGQQLGFRGETPARVPEAT